MTACTTNDLPRTFVFRTPKRATGLLQITGHTENPPGVKVRYKLVQTVSLDGTFTTVSTEGQKATITARLGERQELVVFVGQESLGWSFRQTPTADSMTETVESSSQIRMQDGSLGKGFVLRSRDSVQYVAITPDGPVPFGELLFRDNPAITEAGGVFTFADIRKPDGALVPVSARVRAASVAAGTGFGPVIERILNDPDDDPRNSFLDLDTGTVFDDPVPPPTGNMSAEMRIGFALGSVESLQRAVRERKVDLIGDASGDSLMGCDLVAVPVANEQFESATVETVAGRLKEITLTTDRWNSVTLHATNTPATWLFKTREGGMGLVQITGFTDNPRAVMLRYKLVQSDKTK